MMSHPFRHKVNTTPSKDAKDKKNIQEDYKYVHYETKIFTNISMKAIGTQRFSQDFRYVVDVDV